MGARAPGDDPLQDRVLFYGIHRSTDLQAIEKEIEAVLLRLLDKADGDIAKAQRGIVFIDEIDKLKSTDTQGGSSGEKVQHALLKIMESASVRLSGVGNIDTTDMLFICAGAFVGLENITAKTHAFGFISIGGGQIDDNQRILDRLNSRVKPTDLFEFGLIPEFAGRLPVIANVKDLTKEMLVQIMVDADIAQLDDQLSGRAVRLDR